MSCSDNKTITQELSDDLAIRTQIATQGNHSDRSLLRSDSYTSGILENHNNYTIDEIHNNYVTVTENNQNHVGLENYKRFFLNNLMSQYKLEQYDNVDMLDFFLNEYYTLVHFKNPVGEYKLIKSLQGKISEDTFTKYVIKTRTRSEEAIATFRELFKDEIVDSEEMIGKLNASIKLYEDLLIKIDNLNS